jgi:hypothetical protein
VDAVESRLLSEVTLPILAPLIRHQVLGFRLLVVAFETTDLEVIHPVPSTKRAGLNVIHRGFVKGEEFGADVARSHGTMPLAIPEHRFYLSSFVWQFPTHKLQRPTTISTITGRAFWILFSRCPFSLILHPTQLFCCLAPALEPLIVLFLEQFHHPLIFLPCLNRQPRS